MAPIQKRECNPEICGCSANIRNLQRENDAQWEKMKTQDANIKQTDEKFNKILIRINVLLGSFAASLLVGIAIYFLKGG